jgi:hypothetical protein
LHSDNPNHGDWCMDCNFADTPAINDLCNRGKRLRHYFVSQYTDGPATRWNVIDRQTQEWVRRFATEAEAQQHADKLNAA